MICYENRWKRSCLLGGVLDPPNQKPGSHWGSSLEYSSAAMPAGYVGSVGVVVRPGDPSSVLAVVYLNAPNSVLGSKARSPYSSVLASSKNAPSSKMPGASSVLSPSSKAKNPYSSVLSPVQAQSI